LIAVKKGNSKLSLERRAAKARSDLDVVLIELHDGVDELGAELRRQGSAVEVVEFRPAEDPLVLATRELSEVRTLLEHAEAERDEAREDGEDAWSRVKALQAALDMARRVPGQESEA